MRSFQDKVVLITGVTAGIGRITARRLARLDARVVVCGRDGDRLAAAVADIPGGHGVQCDVGDPVAREELVRTVLRLHGRIDVLVNNAGQGRVGLLTELTADQINDLVQVNLVAVADMTRLVLPHLQDRGGHIVMISSVAGWVPFPPLSVYSTTKAGVNALVTALRREVPRRIRVHVVCPGPVETEWLTRAVRSRPAEGEAHQRLSGGVSPDRVAAAVERCLTARRSRTVAVPRLFGVARLGSLAPVNRLIDVVVAPMAPLLVRLAKRYGHEL